MSKNMWCSWCLKNQLTTKVWSELRNTFVLVCATCNNSAVSPPNKRLQATGGQKRRSKSKSAKAASA